MAVHDAARFWSGRPVALTGATGFVGYHVALQLAQRGAQVSALVRAPAKQQRLAAAGVRCVRGDLADAAALAATFRDCDLVFHLAGAVDFEEDWQRFRQVNVAGTHQVLATARAAGVRRVIHTSSIVAVGASRQPRLLNEESPWNLAALGVPYATTKRQAEVLALAAGMDVVVVNPASVVGPDDFANSLFGTLCRRFWRGRIPFYFGGGNNFVDVRDVAAGHLLAAERGQSGQRYILGGCNRSYADFFNSLAQLAPRTIFRLRLPAALGQVAALVNARLRGRTAGKSYITPGQARLLSLFFYFDSSKAHQELGYDPRPLKQSLADTYRFWMQRRSA
jgi:dihydroflavonol-4-reductase